MRKKIVAGNWKMNLQFDQADDLLYEITSKLDNFSKKVEVVICPPSVFLELATDYAEDSIIKIGAQNVSQYNAGAYTGEISAAMLNSMDVSFCIIGHSERRKYFQESDQTLAAKVDQLLEQNIQPVFCIGEVLEERESNHHFEVVENQIVNGLFHLSANEISNVIIAYEPVWAIGTGRTATPDQAQEMHAFIRKILENKFGTELSHSLSILYGGSCNASNAAELFSQKDVDGGLIGGASLKAEDFIQIINSF